MARKDSEANSVGQAKVLPFGAVLRAAIKQEFGTGKEFAAKLGISEGRVSQFMSGAESLTAQTLQEILSAFPSLADQELLHAAWIRTFAPAPLQQMGDGECEEQVHRLIASQGALMSAGRARELLNSLTAVQTRCKDPELRFLLLRASAEVALFLGRSTHALDASCALSEQAKATGDAEWIGRGLWLQATATRNAPMTTGIEIAQTHEQAASFIRAWNPTGEQNRKLSREMRAAIGRDRALALIALNQRHPVAREELDRTVAQLDRCLEADMGDDTRAIFLEVKARVLLAQVDILGTEEALEQAQRVRRYVSYDHDIKMGILNGQLLLARGLPEQALATFRDNLDQSYLLDDLHHARTIEWILSRKAL